LSNNVRAQETNQKVEDYRKENQDLIVINESKKVIMKRSINENKAQEFRELQTKLREEEMEKQESFRQRVIEEKNQKETRLKQKDELLDKLVTLILQNIDLIKGK
jgi:hypothetical protein